MHLLQWFAIINLTKQWMENRPVLSSERKRAVRSKPPPWNSTFSIKEDKENKDVVISELITRHGRENKLKMVHYLTSISYL